MLTLFLLTTGILRKGDGKSKCLHRGRGFCIGWYQSRNYGRSTFLSVKNFSTKLSSLTQFRLVYYLGSRGHCQNCNHMSSSNKDFILLVGRCSQMAVCFSKRSTGTAFKIGVNIICTVVVQNEGLQFCINLHMYNK